MSTSTYTGWHDDRLPGLGFLGVVVFVFTARNDDGNQKKNLQKEKKKTRSVYNLASITYLTFCWVLRFPSASAI